MIEDSRDQFDEPIPTKNVVIAVGLAIVGMALLAFVSGLNW